jgi:glycosyltransferase involved in cell wall biosynthesis
MNAVPRLSIGLPVYNGEDLLPEAIEAILGQSYKDFELIISDNASTDGTAEICRRYGEQDSRVRYIRQPRNIGMVANHNFLIGVARGELFKWASHDDLYARDFLQRCVDALDEHPEAVLAHAWCVLLDMTDGTPIEFFKYPEATASPRAPERFRSMLFDGKGDWTYAVFRTSILRQTPLHGTYHGGDRTLITELALHGTLHQVPEWLFFRRDHPNRQLSTREWCTIWDPCRASRLRHPAARLYLEYLCGYVSAIRRTPLPRADKRECYRYLAQWLASRVVSARQQEELPPFSKQPVIYLARQLSGLIFLRRGALAAEQSPPERPDVQVDSVVPGRERKHL